MHPVLSMQNICKSFHGIQVLHSASLDLKPGEILALMGENGAGKSTLMKILSGVYQDYSGTMSLDGQTVKFRDTRDAASHGIAMIYQELNLIQSLNVAENIFLGREPRIRGGCIDYVKMHKDAAGVLNSLKCSCDTSLPVSELKVGHQQLVEIGKALSMNAGILIMDEPTSALSARETEMLFSVMRSLKEEGVSIIFISHRIGEVFQIADRIEVLRDGMKVDERDTDELDRAELIRLMVGRPLTQFFVREGAAKESTVLEVSDLSLGRRDRSGSTLKDISFNVRQGEIFGVSGLLGSGRTELIETLFGVFPGQTTGEVLLDGEELQLRSPADSIRAGIGYITEDRAGNGLVLNMETMKNLSLASLFALSRYGWIKRKAEEINVTEYMIRFNITLNNLHLPVSTLSGGNQQKVMLAKWLMTKPSLLLLDEPTRGIDVGAKYEIYTTLSRLANSGMGILMTSSEMPELLSLCDRIMVLREGRCSAIFAREGASQEAIMDAAAP